MRRPPSSYGRSESSYQPIGPPLTRTVNTEKTRGELAADHQAWADQQPVQFSCAFCEWTLDASAFEGRDHARTHRLEQHPHAKQTKRPRRFTTRILQSDPSNWQTGEAKAAQRRAQIQAREEQR